MNGPVAIVTGAGRGIGRAAALELSAAGYRLTLVSRNADELEETARLTGGGLVVVADVRDPEQVQELVGQTLEQFESLDAIVHCAGAAPVRSIGDMSPREWNDVIDVNLSAAFYLLHWAWPTFRRQGSGVVVNISSFAARDPFPGFAAYGAAKAGVNLLGFSAAREGQAFGVRVHTIAPAAVETSMFREILTEDQYPGEKALAPADIAQVIRQCVMGDLQYTSGEVIYLSKVRQ
jgi:NAD(P)-dependent dehydrogenase (short-subunit alcohol dehydrogenase family)